MNNYDVLREQTTQGLVGFSRALLSLVLVRGDGGSSQNDSRVGFLVAGHRLRTADPHCTGDTNDKLAQIFYEYQHQFRPRRNRIHPLAAARPRHGETELVPIGMQTPQSVQRIYP